MALFATLLITGKQADPADATKTVPIPYYFFGAKELYADAAMTTATGIKDVTATHRGEAVISDVGDLLLHGVLRTVEVEIKTDSGISIKKLRYAGEKSATIEADLVNKTWSGVGKLKGKPIKAVIERRDRIFK
ncbi:MAG: hypothetical protein V7L00_27120 [Nostoc sp.]|uniref:hypothetical protein n=1 Tax=Nostoc sp. TaxID=1180 RepID=UPI002FFCDBB6